MKVLLPSFEAVLNSFCFFGSQVDKRAFVSYRCCTTWLHARVVVIGDWSQVQVLSMCC